MSNIILKADLQNESSLKQLNQPLQFTVLVVRWYLVRLSGYITEEMEDN